MKKIAVTEVWGTGNSGLYSVLFSNGVLEAGGNKDVEVTLVTSSSFEFSEISKVLIKRLFLQPRKRRNKFIRLMFIMYSYIKVYKFLSNYKPDILHFQPIGFSLIPADLIFYILAGRHARRTFITLHNINDPKSNRIYNYFLNSYITKPSVNVIVHDGNNYSYLINNGLKGLSIVEHGLYSQYFDTIRKEEWTHKSDIEKHKDKLRLLIFGAIHDYKGIDEFARIFSKVGCKDVVLIIVGFSKDRSLGERIRITASECDNIEYFDEYVPDEMLESVFSCVDLCVFPYRDSFRSQSGALYLSYTFLTPVIVTDVGGLSWSVKRHKSGCIMNVTKMDVASCLEDLKNNTQLVRKYNRSVYTLRDSLDWKNLGKRYIELYGV